MVILRATAAWAAIIPVAILNGIARQTLLTPVVGEHRAHQISSLSAAAAVLLIAILGVRWIGVRTARAGWVVGGLWLALTVGFEFCFGRAVAGASWKRLLQDYDLSRGRLWVLVLLVVLIAPSIAARVRPPRNPASPTPGA